MWLTLAVFLLVTSNAAPAVDHGPGVMLIAGASARDARPLGNPFAWTASALKLPTRH